LARVTFWREERALAQPDAKSPTRGNVAGFAGEEDDWLFSLSRMANFAP
jgi:hypothetical protein